MHGKRWALYRVLSFRRGNFAILDAACRSIHDFALVKAIGNGAVSTVFYALCKRSCLRVAIKIYTKSKLTKLNARQVST